MDDCDYVFSTIHKSKGKEYDNVTILQSSVPEGFPNTLPKLKHIPTNGNFIKTRDLTDDELNKIRSIWNEELNIYYVAVTRAKYILQHSLGWLNQSDDLESDEIQQESIEIRDLEKV